MKKSVLTLALTAFVAGIIFTGCNSQGEKVDAAKAEMEAAEKSLQKANENYDAEYSKFKEESDMQIAANEERIAELKKESKKMKASEKIEYEKTIEDLEDRNERMKEKMKDYKNEGNEKWESFKREFSHDMDELGQSLKDLGKNNVK